MRRKVKKVINTLLVAFAIVAFWRGVWGLLDIYLLPAQHEVSLWVSLIIGVIILSATESLIERLI